jgi:RNA polymerase sigma-70 factor (family 1)
MSALSNLSDNELYILLAQDNEAAFALLYKRYWKKMLYKAQQKLLAETDAEEIVQDTFVDIWNSRRRIEIQHTFHTYIAAIVRYKILAKRAANNRFVPATDNNVYELRIVDDSTQQWLRFADLQEEIENVVKALPEKCQIVFRLSRESGLSDKQIAEKLDLSQKTVEGHITKALKSLRTSIGQLLGVML